MKMGQQGSQYNFYEATDDPLGKLENFRPLRIH